MNGDIKKFPNSHLLKDRKVVEEINRHLWIESERVGRDIGFDEAAQDWLLRFSKDWMNYHLPKRNVKGKVKAALKKTITKRHSAPRKKLLAKKA